MKVMVIGSGPAGYPAALKLKALGADVKIIEKGDFGGTCLNRGCIPSKAIIEIAHRYHNFEEILKKGFFEKNFDAKPIWDKIKEHKKNVVNQIRTSLEKLFLMKKIDIIRGKAKILSKNTIEVENNDKKEIFDFDKLIIATGTVPFYPKPFDRYREILTDSDKIFDIEKKPQKLTIIGAGVIGIEMACFFNAIGSEVNVIDIMPEILPSEDPSVVKFIRNSLEKRGVKFYLSSKTKEIDLNGDKKVIILENDTKIESDEIMIAAGRISQLSELGLEKADIKFSKYIEVNEFMQTSNPNIYACGDVNGISLLAHSATRQGEIAAKHIMGQKTDPFDKNIIPSCIYSWPEYATVGINQNQAKEKGINIKLKKAYFQVLGRAVANMNTEGFIQMIFDENETLIGAQILGGPATEIIHILALGVKFKMKIDDINSIIYAHPTMSEIIMEALNK